MKSLCLLPLVLFAFTEIAEAQIRQFPYQAIAEADHVVVHSGPGSRYYPTNTLSRGDRVTVHRHDPGGWFMISPLPGSFSWIRAEHVRQSGANRGVVTSNNVAVRVGSTLDDSRDVEQRRLSTGDQIEILDEQTLQSEDGPIRMYRITPPRGEFRWVSGKFVVPIDQVIRRQNDRDPYATPSLARRSVNKISTDTTNSQQSFAEKPFANSSKTETLVISPKKQPRAKFTHNGSVRRSGPDPQQVDAERKMLRELDDQFRAIIQQQTTDWEFTRLEQAYILLQQNTSLAALSSQLDLRLAAVERYKNIKSEYDSLVLLTSQTNRRDAELAKLQQAVLNRPQPPVATSQPRQIMQSATSQPLIRRQEKLLPIPEPNLGRPQRQPFPVARARGRYPAGPRLTNNPPPPLPPTPNAVANVRFEGAGIVQRVAASFPGTPSHVLLAPNGRILAYLQAGQGLNLDRYLGQAMGVNGNRTFRNDLQQNLIMVRRLTPVRLATSVR